MTLGWQPLALQHIPPGTSCKGILLMPVWLALLLSQLAEERDSELFLWISKLQTMCFGMIEVHGRLMITAGSMLQASSVDGPAGLMQGMCAAGRSSRRQLIPEQVDDVPDDDVNETSSFPDAVSKWLGKITDRATIRGRGGATPRSLACGADCSFLMPSMRQLVLNAHGRCSPDLVPLPARA